MEAALCAVYSPRDPIAEFWQRKISLRALHALIVHMPPDNVFYRALVGSGWSETEWILHDLSDMLRDVQLTVSACAPFVEHPLEDEDIRPRLKPPAMLAEETAPLEPVDEQIQAQERAELLALIQPSEK